MKRPIITMVTMLLVLISALLISGCGSQNSEKLAQCLSEKGAVLYGTEWCSHCQNQKEAFGQSFSYIEFIDCDRQSEKCFAEGIEGYPTWVINGQKYPGNQDIIRLADISGCPI
ncbi:hypothetical protein JW968_04005 [Candidatus Woesearchaeota archaeon]|nr:hypothetical protein [Candidatus Woesearchaeota archaeon]